jgi:hypothetical protein
VATKFLERLIEHFCRIGVQTSDGAVESTPDDIRRDSAVSQSTLIARRSTSARIISAIDAFHYSG